MKIIKNIVFMIGILCKCSLIVTLFIVSFQYLNKVFYNREVFRNEGFRLLPQQSMDVLVLGSSHAQYSFQPHFFHDDTGLYSFVLGSACQPLEVTVEMLKEAYKTQTPKLVILEVFTAMPMKEMCHGDECYVMAEYEMTGQEKYNTIAYLPKEKQKLYQNDFLIYHNDWKTMKDFSYFKTENMNYPKAEFDNLFGYVYFERPASISNYWQPRQPEVKVSMELIEKDEKNLNEILRLCHQHGSELLLYKTPIDNIDDINYGYLDAVWRWAKQAQVPYVDLVRNTSELGMYMEEHSNSFHAYITGASLITHYLAEKVNAGGIDFTHTDITLLDRLYANGSQEFTRRVLKQEPSAKAILKRLKNASGYCFISYQPIKKIDFGFLEQLQSYLPNLDVSKPYYAIVEDGRLIVDSQEPFIRNINKVQVSLSHQARYIGSEMEACQGDLCIVYTDKQLSNPIDYPIQLGPIAWHIAGQSYRDFMQK